MFAHSRPTQPMMCSRSLSNGLSLLALCVALIASLSVYVGLGYAGSHITLPFSPAVTRGSKVSAQVEQISACAMNRQEDWLAQSKNQTLMTTNLLLICPCVAEVLKIHQQTSFTQQLRNYIDFQLEERADPRLEWIFFLKDHEMLFSHSPRSLKKFLHSAPAEINVLSFAHGSMQSALGLFAIRLDDWSVRLLDSILQLLEQRPGLSETEATKVALAYQNNARSVAYVPQWWLEVRSNCLEHSTWEAQFGVTYVVKTDQLCCGSDPCRNALSHAVEHSRTTSNQVIDSQDPLTLGSDFPVEHTVEVFWTRMRNLNVHYDVGPAVQLSENLATEQRAAG